MEWLKDFVRESNRIEGILRKPSQKEIDAHAALLSLGKINVADMEAFVAIIAPGKPLRDKSGMNVSVGNHLPMEGGPWIKGLLEQLLGFAQGGTFSPYEVHTRYETLHPFMDGNGRSGRALWLWMMMRRKSDWPRQLGFLHSWYYQSLEVATKYQLSIL